MRAVIQRVSAARCEVAGEVTGAIGPGLLVFLGVRAGDGEAAAAWLARKLPALRIFEGEGGKMERSVRDLPGGGILLISQFTLFGDVRKGTRPSFHRAAPPAVAEPLYERFHALLAAELGRPVATGRFAAMMAITAVNDGPVTLILDSPEGSDAAP